MHSLPTESTANASGLRGFRAKFAYFPGQGIGEIFSEKTEIHLVFLVL